MSNFSATLARRFALALVLTLAAVSGAQAQATRTWVSGEGDDVNPCSRTAPCKTFAGAISKTARSGVISTLDPGGFGAVTITKSITIEGTGTNASLLSSGANGVIVNITDPADTSKTVVLRNLSIDGAATGLDGVRVLSANTVVLDGVKIRDFTSDGVEIAIGAAATTRVLARDLTVDRAVNGINLSNAGAGAVVDLDGSSISSSSNACISVVGNGSLTLRRSLLIGCTTAGVAVNGAGAEARLFAVASTISASGTAIAATGANARATLTDMIITGNAIGLDAQAGATLATYGDNRVSGNVSDGGATVELGTQ